VVDLWGGLADERDGRAAALLAALHEAVAA